MPSLVTVNFDCLRSQYMVVSCVVAMVTCAVFLRLSCVLQLAFLLLAAISYTYIIEMHRYEALHSGAVEPEQ